MVTLCTYRVRKATDLGDLSVLLIILPLLSCVPYFSLFFLPQYILYLNCNVSLLIVNKMFLIELLGSAQDMPNYVVMAFVFYKINIHFRKIL